VQVDFLLELAAHRGRRRLPGERQHGNVIVLRVVKPVQQMDRARPGGREADAELAGELRVRAGHERRLLLVPHLHEIDLLLVPVDRGDDAVDAVARIAVDAFHAPSDQALDEKIADGCHVVPLRLRFVGEPSSGTQRASLRSY
jgi:hypothetical protein